ncbi:hypothetical protein FRB97_007070 [Tulasnella sp. 331]|nr:hypothetical protein FRB97_007070 [Tulasnella sp. 331]
MSAVTRYWRDTALSRRCLWTYFNWSGANPEEKITQEGFDPDVEQMQHAMSLLIPEVRRWASVKIHVDRDPLELALELCDMAAPLLHTLSIRCSESDGVEDKFILFNDQTPALRYLRLVGVPIVWTGPLLHNLTTLHLADFEDGFGPSVEELISIITASPRLERLALDNAGISVHAAGDFNPKVIHMPHLQHVHMTRLDRDVYVWFARYMKGERVHTYIGSEFEETVAEIDVSTTCPFPNLKKLVAIHAQINTPIVREILKLCKTLTDIHFYYCSVPDDVLEELVWGPGKRRCPKLVHLKLQRCNGFSVELLKKIVLSRQANSDHSAALPLMRPPTVLKKTEVMGTSLSVSAEDLKWFGAHGVTWVDQAAMQEDTRFKEWIR